MDICVIYIMKRKLLSGLLFIALFLLLSGMVMYLWNALFPSILHAEVINYWQALGLMVLCRILFGRFHFGDQSGKHWGRGPTAPLKDKLMNMDETDRLTFKEEWKRRCEQWKERRD